MRERISHGGFCLAAIISLGIVPSIAVASEASASSFTLLCHLKGESNKKAGLDPNHFYTFAISLNRNPGNDKKLGPPGEAIETVRIVDRNNLLHDYLFSLSQGGGGAISLSSSLAGSDALLLTVAPPEAGKQFRTAFLFGGTMDGKSWASFTGNCISDIQAEKSGADLLMMASSVHYETGFNKSFRKVQNGENTK